MKKYLFLILFAVISLESCNQKNSTKEKETDLPKKPNIKAEIEKLDKLLAEYDGSSQTFKVPVSKISTITGKQGTIIHINPANLETETAQPMKDSIEVELKELTNQSQLLKANAQTVSNGKLLVSGGAYYINLKSNGQKLKLKKDKTLQVVFPKIAKEEMFLFYGEQDSLGTMNWNEAKQKLATQQLEKVNVLRKKELFDELPSDTSMRSDKKSSIESYESFKKIYEPVELKQLGWINCDRFYDMPDNKKTTVSFAFSPKDSLKYAKVYLVFQDINSVMQCYYMEGEEYGNAFLNVPIGTKVKLIAVTVKNGALYGCETPFVIEANKKINIKLSEYSKETLGKLFN